jgi:hypothetical protein
VEKSAFHLHSSYLLCVLNALDRVSEKTILYLFERKLLAGLLANSFFALAILGIRAQNEARFWIRQQDQIA